MSEDAHDEQGGSADRTCDETDPQSYEGIQTYIIASVDYQNILYLS